MPDQAKQDAERVIAEKFAAVLTQAGSVSEDSARSIIEESEVEAAETIKNLLHANEEMGSISYLKLQFDDAKYVLEFCGHTLGKDRQTDGIEKLLERLKLPQVEGAPAGDDFEVTPEAREFLEQMVEPGEQGH